MPGAMISSPVEKIATIGFRTTETIFMPSAARTPVSREDNTSPFRKTISPLLISVPAKLMLAPGAIALLINNLSFLKSVCSIMTIASAPLGNMPPVAIGRAKLNSITDFG